MPVITCPACSTQLKVPEGLGGKKAKCSTCQNIFQIPGQTSVRASSPPPVPPSPAKKSAPGRPSVPTKAPSRVVEDFDDLDDLPSRRPRKPTQRSRDNDYDDDFEDEDDRPRRSKKGKSIKKKKGSPVLLLSLMGGGAFLLIVGICVGLWLLWPFGGAATAQADLFYVPDNSDLIVSVRVADLMKSNAYQKVVKDIPQVETSLKMMKNETGLDAKDITSLFVGGKSQGNDGLGVIHTSVAMTTEMLLGNKKAKKISVGSHTVYRIDRKTGFCLINDRLVILGAPDTIQTVLKRNSKAKLSSSLNNALSSLNTSSTVAMATSTRIPENQIPGQIPGVNNLTKGDWWALEVQVGNNVQITARGNFTDAKAAGDAKTTLDGLLAIVKLTPNVPPDILKIMNGLSVSTSGSQIVGKISVEIDPILQLAKNGGGLGGFPIGAIPGLGGGGNPFPPGGGGNPFPPGGGGNPFPPGGGGFPGNGLNNTDLDRNGVLPRNQEQMVQVNLQANVNYQIDLESKAFDCYLILKDSKGRILRSDDDGGAGLDSKIQYRPIQTGTYTIVVRAFGRQEGGPYRLRVRH